MNATLIIRRLSFGLWLALLISLLLTGSALAQTPTPFVVNISPNVMVAGQGGVLTVQGNSLTPDVRVRLTGPATVELVTVFANPNQVQANVLGSVNAGLYTIEVYDVVPPNTVYSNTFTLNVQLPTATPTPSPTPTPTPSPTTAPPITVSSINPTQITQGQSGIMSIVGTNFRPTTLVRLLGYGTLSAALSGDTVLNAALPNNIPVGSYVIEVSDPSGGYDARFTLTVIAAPPPTDRPQPPTAAPPATDIPGAPSLVVRSFSANPTTVRPGQTVTFTFDLYNQGSRPAQGVSVAVDTGGKFVPSNGQSTIILPDIPVAGSSSVSLSVIAANDTPGGPQTVGITMTYRDFTGQSYTARGSLTVNVEAVPQSSQITLSRYQFDPNPVVPGQPVTITVLLTNTGNETASQVLATVNADGILLAGPEGNSFPVGDIRPGASASIDMPLIVNSTAKAGPQSQVLGITFLQKGESRSINATMTIEVARVQAPAPVMIVESYDFGGDVLQPGQEFTLTLQLRNIGNDDASEVQVTFGTVDNSGGGVTNPTPDSSTTTTTTTSNNFAPLDTLGTQYIGDVPAEGDAITITQRFIVNGSVESGVYPLPVTLRYQRSDGASSQDNLRASIPVVVPPQIRINQPSPLPEQTEVGSILPLSLEISNRGRKGVNFTNAVVTTDNGQIISGATTFLGPLRNDDATTLDASLMPESEGQMTITVSLNYTDDLNRPQVIEQKYVLTVNPPPEPIDIGQEIPDPGVLQPVEEPSLSDRDLLGRLLLGLLGLGS